MISHNNALKKTIFTVSTFYNNNNFTMISVIEKSQSDHTGSDTNRQDLDYGLMYVSFIMNLI